MEPLIQTHQVIEHLYIHIPFCLKKCEYCSFYSKTLRREDDSIEILYFLNSLEQEIRCYKRLFDFQLKTIYFGGGTPSLLTADQIGRLLDIIAEKNDSIADNADINVKSINDVKPSEDVNKLTQAGSLRYRDIEITLECNPNTINPEALKAYKQAGINRISLGVQSFNDKILSYLGRIHNAENALNAIEAIKNAGFENFSADLIYGIPGQSKEQFIEDIMKCINLKIPHISFYGLTLDDEVPLYRDMNRIPDDDFVCDQYYSAQKLLIGHQYQSYEISNFALNGYHSRHNIAYWTGKTYLAAGPSASGFLKTGDFMMKQNVQDSTEEKLFFRYTNHADLNAYLKKWETEDFPCFDQVELINAEEAEKEFIITRLRLKEGIQLQEYQEMFNQDFLMKYKPALKKVLQADLIKITDHAISINPEHYLLMNEILLEFL